MFLYIKSNYYQLGKNVLRIGRGEKVKQKEMVEENVKVGCI